MKYSLIIFILLFSFHIDAQNKDDIVKSFDSIVNTGNNYQEYKVIKKVNLNFFKKQLSSTRDSLETNIKSLQEDIDSFEKEISDLKRLNISLSQELDDLKNSKDEINLLGLKMTKTSYSTTVWIIIFILLLALAFFIIKYRNRNIVTQELKDNLKRTDKEFEEYKHHAIEKQQKLGRELLDAQKKVQTKNRKN